MTVVQLVCVALGAVAGGIARFGLTQWLRRCVRSLGDAAGTTVANALGSLLLGALAHALVEGTIGANPFALLATGFCGALTTWSTLARGVAERVLDGRVAQALTYLGANLVAGLGLMMLGWRLVEADGHDHSHLQLVDVVESGDIDRALQVLEAHLMRVREGVLAMLEEAD